MVRLTNCAGVWSASPENRTGPVRASRMSSPWLPCVCSSSVTMTTLPSPNTSWSPVTSVLGAPAASHGCKVAGSAMGVAGPRPSALKSRLSMISRARGKAAVWPVWSEYRWLIPITFTSAGLKPSRAN